MILTVISNDFYAKQWNFIAEGAQASEHCEIGRCFDGRESFILDIRISVNGFEKVHGHIATR